MSISKRALSFTISAAAAVLLMAPTPSQAQIGLLPASVRQQLQAPNADVVAISLTTAQGNPALATAALQTPINLLGGNTEAAANAVKAFADMAAQLVAQGPNHNAALAAAFAVAVRNAVGNPANADLVNGEWSAIIAAALAEANTVLEDPEVQQAILDNAPGTEESVQAATGGEFGGGLGGGVGRGGGAPFAPPGSPAH